MSRSISNYRNFIYRYYRCRSHARGQSPCAGSGTNAYESLNSAIRKFTKNRKQYPSEQSALKLVFMAIREASKRWTRPIRHWKQALNHFAILFPDRMPKDYQAYN